MDEGKTELRQCHLFNFCFTEIRTYICKYKTGNAIMTENISEGTLIQQILKCLEVIVSFGNRRKMKT